MGLFKRIQSGSSLLRGGRNAASLYEAATPSRARTPTTYVAQDFRRDLNRMSRLRLLAVARWLYANDGFTRGAIRDKSLYAIGEGLQPLAKTSNTGWNVGAEDYWKQWCKVADVTGRHDFNRLQQLASIAIDRDGDAGFVLLKAPSGFPQLQFVESHRIGDPALDGEEFGGKNGWWDGVKLSDICRPLAYSVVTQDFFGMKTRVEVQASNFVHLMDAERADQIRGVTALYHAINQLHDKKDIVDFERKGVKFHSALAAVLKQKGASLQKDWESGTAGAESDPNQKLSLMDVLDGGEIPIIGAQDDLVLTTSNRPSPAFTGFLDFIIRDVAAGLGLPFEFVWNPEKLGGTAQRFVLQKAQRTFRERQKLLTRTLLDRLWFWVISVGIKRGDLAPMDGAWRVQWQMPAEITVDAGRDSNADREDVKMGLMTEAEHFGRRGLDWTIERDQSQREADDLLARAKQLVTKYQIDLTFAIQLLKQQTQQMVTATGSAPSGGGLPPEKQGNQDPNAPQK